MIDLLIFRGILKLVRLTHSSPKNIPFATIWWHDPYASCLHGIDHRVVDVSRLVNLEAKGHVSVHHAELVNGLYLLVRTRLDVISPILVFQKGLSNSDFVAVLGVREEDSELLQRTLNVIGLHQSRIGAVRLKYRPRNLPLFSREHHIRNIMWIVPLHFFLKSTIILNFTIFINVLKTIIKPLLEEVRSCLGLSRPRD